MSRPPRSRLEKDLAIGYTIYWTRKRSFTDEQWDAFIAHCRRIIDACHEKLSLGWHPEQHREDYDSPPRVSDDMVSFAGGSAEESCETFQICKRNPKDDRKDYPEDLRAFDFCKTRREPYTTAVAACAAAASLHLGFDVSCDGHDDHVEIGLDLFRKTARDEVPAEEVLRLYDALSCEPPTNLGPGSPPAIGAEDASVFEIKVCFEWRGVVRVSAKTRQEALEAVQSGFALTESAGFHQNDARITGWVFDSSPNKKVLKR